MVFLHYPKCTTCQKAKKWLDSHGVAYTARHIKESSPTSEELKTWQAASGLPWKRFFNTSGLLYKSMNLKERLPGMSEEGQAELLATDGMLVKRPLLIGDPADGPAFVLAGFKEAQWDETLRPFMNHLEPAE